jgi:murein DD-endopeptidase MepM/ murein hydrolase activator NlpD
MPPLPLTRRAFIARAAVVLAGGGLAASHRPRPALGGPQPTALAFTWGNSAIADLPFSELFLRDHTLVLRFLAQYAHAYTAPLLAARGFLVAQGDFFGIEPSGSTKLVVSAGTKRRTYPTRLEPGRWYHLALVRNGDELVLYLDGRQLRPPLEIAKARPKGSLRLGRGTAAGAQFYGLIDDVALARRALSAARIRALARAPFLTGGERDLAPVLLRSSPPLVPVSTARDGSADLAMVPLGPVVPLLVPFPPGEAWEVIEGFDDPLGSHRGYAAFAWDFVLAGRPRSETNGRPFLAAAPGTVELLVDRHGPGPPSWNYVSVRTVAGQICDYLHLVKDSAQVGIGEPVEAGRQLGSVGDTGVGAAAYHLHLAVTTLGEAAREKPGYVTIPAFFGGYDASDDAGQTWRAVAQGVPVTGQWVRRPSVAS